LGASDATKATLGRSGAGRVVFEGTPTELTSAKAVHSDR
jgi:hypothetical protein